MSNALMWIMIAVIAVAPLLPAPERAPNCAVVFSDEAAK